MSSSGRAGDATVYRIDDKGGIYVPRTILEQVGLDAKMRVTFRIEDKTLVIEKAAGADNPLDGLLGKKLDGDLFGKIAREQEERKRRQLEGWGDKIEEASQDETPPDHPFGRD
jgi:bifunctional DNA-binding transcriptional regulator/antitoxin component of YhaV-PrlF toxin-antitoxin module